MKQQQDQMKVKGSVLLTVVMVMFIMVMFLMSTLVLTSSANRRTYYTYFETQAQFAAQAALDAVTNNAYHSSDFSDYVRGLGTENGTFKVYFDDTDIPLKEGDGNHKYVECTVQKLAEKNYVWDSKLGQLCAQDGWKISAVAEVGHGENTSKVTVVNYIYSNIRDDEEAHSNRPKNTWDYQYMLDVVHDETDGEEKVVPVLTDDELATDQACVSLSEMNADNADTMGKMNAGAFEFPDGRTQYRAKARTLGNDGISTGQCTYINSNFLSGDIQYYALEPGTGMIMMGDLDYQNHMFVWSNTPSSKIDNYKDLPYIYVDGKMHGKTLGVGYMGNNNTPVTSRVGYNGQNFNAVQTNAETSPVNVYAGAYYEDELRDNIRFKGDIYLYESEGSNNTTTIWGRTDSKIATFVENNIYRTNSGTEGYVGGDLVSKNGTLNFYMEQGNLTIGGDLIFANPQGILSFEKAGGKTITVNGTLVINAAYVSSDGVININAKGGVYVADGTTFGSTIRINGIDISSVNWGQLAAANEGKEVKYFVNGTEYTATQSSTHAFIETLDVDVSVDSPTGNAATDYQTLCGLVFNKRVDYPDDYLSKLGTAPDYSLFPYSQRLDEIWEEYVRWDIWDGNTPGFATPDDAKAYFDGVVSGDIDDPQMRESYAAGHTYYGVQKSGASGLAKAGGFEGTRYFLATHPAKYKADGKTYQNAFIKPITTYSRKAAVENLGYCDTFDALEATYGTLPEYDYTNLGATDVKESVTVFSHNKSGAEDPKTIPAYVVNKSCMLNVKNGGTYFIDPTANNYDVDKPLVLALYNEDQNWSNFNIIVNNSALYKTPDPGKKSLFDYTKPFPYGCTSDSYISNLPEKADASSKCCDEEYEGEVHASRADVIIYFMGYNKNWSAHDKKNFQGGGNSTQMKIFPSGAYSQQMDNGGHGDISYLVNAPMPDGNKKSSWDAEKLGDKFKFELLPNAIIYSRQQELDIGSGVIWGAMIAPTTRLSSKTSPPFSNFAKIEYRMNKTDDPITFWKKHTCWIGSVIAENVNFDNWRSMVFGGNVPAHQVYKKTTIPGDETYSDSSSKGGDEYLGDNIGKFFDNDHMAQG